MLLSSGGRLIRSQQELSSVSESCQQCSPCLGKGVLSSDDTVKWPSDAHKSIGTQESASGVLFCKDNVGIVLQDPTTQTILFSHRTLSRSSAGAASHGCSPAITWRWFVILIKTASLDVVRRCTRECTPPPPFPVSLSKPPKAALYPVSVLWRQRIHHLLHLGKNPGTFKTSKIFLKYLFTSHVGATSYTYHYRHVGDNRSLLANLTKSHGEKVYI